jgi:transposase InsO family protein
LHISRSTVARMLRRAPAKQPPRPSENTSKTGKPEPKRTVIASYPGHVWSTDLTLAPITGGLFAPWLPLALPQCCPFAWWLLVTVDHFSRAVVHVAVFPTHPTAAEVCRALDEAVAIATGPPKYMVTDQGEQFGEAYRDWCASHGIRPRFGAVHEHGSIAVTERVILTIKSELLGSGALPFRKSAMLDALALGARWYNDCRPHRRFHGATPDEIRAGRTPATELPRFETRPRYPTKHALRAERGVKLELVVDYLEGRRHLPIVSLRRRAA